MNRRIGRLLAVAAAVGLYYAIQWAADVVSLVRIAGLDSAVADVEWVGAIDHHLVQLLLALAG